MKEAQLEQDRLDVLEDEAERARLEDKSRRETEIETQKLEQARLKLQQERELADRAAEQKAAAAEAAQREAYRKECKALQDKNLVEFNRFMSICGENNTQEFCMNSPAGQLYKNDFGPTAIQRCIESKMKTGW